MAEAEITQDVRLLQVLEQIVGAPHVLTDHELTEQYETDWTGRYQGRARAVVRPGTTEEVARVMAACCEHGVGVVPQGGNTGLVGASVPRRGEVLLSLRRLDGMEPVDVEAGQVTVGAGATLGQVQAHVRAAGLEVGVDFAARDSATMGGIVSTNAGGERVLRYGMTRAQVLGLEAVLAGGEVVSHMAGLEKDNCGYDLRSLLVGSEGTLGVVTAVRLRLFGVLPHRATALLALDDTAAAIRAVASLRLAVPGLEAAEYFFDEGLKLVSSSLGLPLPVLVEAPVYLLVEAAGVAGVDDQLVAAVGAVDGMRDAIFARSGASRDRLWEYREGHTVALALRGIPLKLDVAVPLQVLDEFQSELRDLVSMEVPDGELVLFGHLAEGNLHVNVLGVGDGEEDRITDRVLGLVGRFGGSISAEHGVGVAKARWVFLSRSPAEVQAMRSIKGALDPHGVLNPGVLFNAEAEAEV